MALPVSAITPRATAADPAVAADPVARTAGAPMPPQSPAQEMPAPRPQAIGAAAPRSAALRVLLIMGHPRADSLCAALAQAYGAAARLQGAEVRTLELHRLAFDPHVRSADFAAQPCEPAVAQAREDLLWSEHVVLVYPLWWGAMPALLKGFLDRLLVPGSAFAERTGGWGFRGLLHGRSAHLLVTMDTPPLIYRWLLRSPGVTALRRDVLGFCGIAPCEVTLFGPVLHATATRRRRWLAQATAAGAALPRTGGTWTRLSFTLRSWLAALRLQFYPMSWLAYTLGAWCATPAIPVGMVPYLWGYAALFLLEAATVFINELVDAPSDRLNRNDGLFNGGSRVLVDARLPAAHLRIAAGLATVAGVAAFIVAAWSASLEPLTATILIAVTTVLCLGYTAPPLRLSYRGLGELDVGLTHGLLVLLIGWMLQGGAWSAPLPWLLALPLSLAIIPSIILANIPDRVADAQIGKGTLAVRLGNRNAALVAAATAIAAAVTGTAVAAMPQSAGLLSGIALPATLHAALVTWLVIRFLRQGAPDGRRDGLIIAALTFMGWFLVVPVWHVMG